jgi:hypothetical protein
MNMRPGECPKCGGPLRAAEYLGQWYADCVLCGYLSFLGEYPLGLDADSVGAVDERAEARGELGSSQ